MKPQLLITLFLALVVAGCATTPVPVPENQTPEADPDSSVSTEQPDGVPAPEPSPAPRPTPDQATLALLNQSERAAANGDIAEALAYAERAVRIDPRRADLWTGLARLELVNEDPDTAIRYARKALSLAGSRADWQRDAWLVIADAKEALGETAEAGEIRERWKTARG